MKAIKVLEMLENGQIEALKDALRHEVYSEVLKGKTDAKKRYSAMKKYFSYINMGGRIACQKPAMVIFEGKTVTSFCNSYSLVFTSEPCGAIELFTDADGNYPAVDKIFRRDGEPRRVYLDKALAEAKSKGYKLTKSEVNGGQFMMHYNGAYFRLGLVDATYQIINEGKEVTAYHNGNPVSPLTIENDIGVAMILPVRCDEEFIKDNGITVIEVK